MRKESGKILFTLSAFFTFVFLFSEATFAAEDSCSFPNSQGGGSAILNGKCYDHAPNLSVCEEGAAAAAISDCSGSKKCCATCTSDAEHDRTCADNCASEWTVSSSQVCSKKCCEKKKTAANINANTTACENIVVGGTHAVCQDVQDDSPCKINLGLDKCGPSHDQACCLDKEQVFSKEQCTSYGGNCKQSTAGRSPCLPTEVDVPSGCGTAASLNKEHCCVPFSASASAVCVTKGGLCVSAPGECKTEIISGSSDCPQTCCKASKDDICKKQYNGTCTEGYECPKGTSSKMTCDPKNGNDPLCCVTDPGSSYNPTSSNSVYTLFEQIPGTQGRNMQFPEYIAAIYKFLIWSIVFAAILMVMIGGFWYLTAAGNTSQVSTAKTIISDALLGLVVILFTWVILSVINPDLVSINLKSLSALKVSILSAPTNLTTGGTTTPGAGTAGSGTEAQIPPGNLAKGCENYKDAFNSAGVDACFLKAIATAESQCNPAAQSGAGACGIMQLLPSTAKQTCDYLKSHPEESIKIAADYFKQNQSTLSSYSGQFNIGNSFSLSGSNVSFGGYTYDMGNDDLIASYNAGAGRGPFSPSGDCPGAPKWQCNINPGGFKETQNYVMKVQKYQKQCNGG